MTACVGVPYNIREDTCDRIVNEIEHKLTYIDNEELQLCLHGSNKNINVYAEFVLFVLYRYNISNIRMDVYTPTSFNAMKKILNGYRNLKKISIWIDGVHRKLVGLGEVLHKQSKLERIYIDITDCFSLRLLEEFTKLDNLTLVLLQPPQRFQVAHYEGQLVRFINCFKNLKANKLCLHNDSLLTPGIFYGLSENKNICSIVIRPYKTLPYEGALEVITKNSSIDSFTVNTDTLLIKDGKNTMFNKISEKIQGIMRPSVYIDELYVNY